jgi:hypothetical protein
MVMWKIFSVALCLLGYFGNVVFKKSYRGSGNVRSGDLGGQSPFRIILSSSVYSLLP